MRRFSWALLFVAALSSCIGHGDEFVRSLKAPTFADLILINGKVITLDKESTIAEAIAIKDGLIVAVGSDRDMRQWRGPYTGEINLGGRTVIPGLIDAHIHATAAGINWDAQLHWENLDSFTAGLAQIAASAKEKRPGDWIVVAPGWSPAQFAEQRLPSRAELDAAAPNNPVYVQILDNAALLNSRALRAIGVSHKSPDPADGHFERYAETDEPTGIVIGRGALRYVSSKIPRAALHQTRQGLRHCFRELNRVGLTSIGDLQDSSVTFAHRRMLSAMAQDSELTVRVNFFIQPEQSGDELEQLKRALEEVKQLSQSELFRFAGFGAILRPGKGKTARTTKDLALGAAAKEWLRLIEFFARSRHDFQIEALGDAAMPGVLDVIETVHRQAPLGSGRIGFTGLNDAAPQTVARIKKFGGIIVQGLELQTGGRIFERVGQSPGRGNLSPRALLEAGVPLGAGSDGFYSGNYSPMLALWGLVTGKDIGGAPSRDIKHNLTRLEALRVHTLGSAWFTGDEHKKGSLEPGKFADLVVLTEDYLTIPEDRIAALESLLTMVGGRVVHAAGPFARTR